MGRAQHRQSELRCAALADASAGAARVPGGGRAARVEEEDDREDELEHVVANVPELRPLVLVGKPAERQPAGGTEPFNPEVMPALNRDLGVEGS